MHGYDIPEAPYKNCEIHSFWVRGSDLGAGIMGPHSKIVLI